ncbi:MAG: SGNH/GDSL hydrolase family protein [Candidatus Hydrogenedens sp.]|jgi:hypothetical protein|nr:SGNH/GDSL hydrolase family protein [Candidatus Hydrogenedens sp.]
MIRISDFFLPALLCLLLSFCQVETPQAEEGVLLVGDSWAQGIWMTGLLDVALAEAGFPEITAIGESCALGGTRAEQWKKPEYRKKITDALALSPSVDMVHLIIGGNDLLKLIRNTHVFEKWTEARREKEWDRIGADIQDLVEFCLSFDQVKVVGLASYDYLNSETAQKAFTALGQEMNFGGMSQEEVNACMIALEKRKKEIADELEGCVYIHNLGLLQHHFDEPPGLPQPGIPPDYEPFPGGDATKAMPDAAFHKVSFGGQEFAGDGIHPGEEAHLIMLKNAMAYCYVPYLEKMRRKTM